jgi:excinuclease ABC subunit C
VVETFVGQFYLQGSQMRTLPSEILLDFNLDDKTLLADSLSELAGRRVNVQTKPRGDRARYLKLARTNAATALTTKLSQQSTVSQRLTALATLLKLPEVKRWSVSTSAIRWVNRRWRPAWCLMLWPAARRVSPL